MIRPHQTGMRKVLADFERYLAALAEQQEAAEIHARMAALPTASSTPAEPEPPAPAPYRLHIALAYAALASALLCLTGSY